MSEQIFQHNEAEEALAIASRRQLLFGALATASAAMAPATAMGAMGTAVGDQQPGGLPTGVGVAQALLHIEIVHPDPEEAFNFMRDCLGAKKVETKVAELGAQLYDSPTIHAKVGNVVFQIVNPSPKVFPSWYDELQARGPCVHNVTFYVDDIDGVTNKMLERGATTIRDQLEPATEESGVGPKGGSDRVVVLDARKQSGLRFEMCEPVLGWPAGGLLP